MSVGIAAPASAAGESPRVDDPLVESLGNGDMLFVLQDPAGGAQSTVRVTFASLAEALALNGSLVTAFVGRTPPDAATVAGTDMVYAVIGPDTDAESTARVTIDAITAAVAASPTMADTFVTIDSPSASTATGADGFVIITAEGSTARLPLEVVAESLAVQPAIADHFLPQAQAYEVQYGAVGSAAFGGSDAAGADGDMSHMNFHTYGGIAPYNITVGGANFYDGQQDDLFLWGYNRANGGAKFVLEESAFGFEIEANVRDSSDDRFPAVTNNFEWNLDINGPSTYASPPGGRFMAFRCDRVVPTDYAHWAFGISDRRSRGYFKVMGLNSGGDLFRVNANGSASIAAGLTLGTNGIAGSGDLDVTGDLRIGGLGSLRAGYPGEIDVLRFEAGELTLRQIASGIVPLKVTRRKNTTGVLSGWYDSDGATLASIDEAGKGYFKGTLDVDGTSFTLGRTLSVLDFGPGTGSGFRSTDTIYLNTGGSLVVTNGNGTIRFLTVNGLGDVFHRDGRTISYGSAVGGRIGAPTDKLGFFGAKPVVKPAGVAPTTQSIHAALVSLGLISA